MVHETNAQEGEMEFAPRTKWEALIIDVWMYVRTYLARVLFIFGTVFNLN